ncbi:MAG TPA: tetratricopeptide repeat protein [Candidatus Paceibacterota bacterium]
MSYFDTATGGEADSHQGARRQGIERFAARCLFALAFLLPVFFIPVFSFPFQFSKALLLSLLVLIALCVWLIARLKDGQFFLPSSPLLIALGAIVGVFALSGLLSGSVGTSLWGQGFEVGTTLNILIVSLLAFLISVLFRGKEQIFGSYLAFLAAFFLTALFHVLRLVLGPGFLSLGVFTETVSNAIGKWNDLGVFFGASALLSLVTIELLQLNRLFRSVIYIALAVSLFFLAVINFGTVWFVLGLFSLIFLVYLISFSSSAPRGADAVLGEDGDMPLSSATERRDVSVSASVRRIPIPSLTVLLISVVFILAGGTIGREISSALNISQIEARPSWQATFAVARQTLIKDPLLGAGPNQFTGEWLQFKPDGINTTIFWNTDFSYGVGLIPTFLATTGILGVMAWVAFFLLFVYTGFKAILSRLSDAFSRYLITSSFLVAFFLWIFTIFYIPSLTVFALAFLFTGLFITALTAEGMSPVTAFSFARDPRAGFVSVLALILLLIGAVTLGYSLVQKYAAAVFFQKGVIAFNAEGNLDTSERLISRAATVGPLDLYYRFLTELSLIRMNTLLSQNQSAVSAESVRSGFQTLLGAALGYARQAVALNPSNYQNFMTLGRVYEAVTPLNIEGAYESAKAAYEQALTQNPRSPAILLTLARLEVAKKDNAKARENIARALREKNNYTEAIFLLAQIEAAEGNIKAAISSVEAASIISPGDPSIFFQLGMLRFTDKDYRGAAGAFERSVALSPTYANAKYFLGLSYDKLSRATDAITQFNDLQKTNPDNAEVKLILSNLRAGRPPFSNAAPPVDDKPEKRVKLPVEEKQSKKGAVSFDED